MSPPTRLLEVSYSSDDDGAPIHERHGSFAEWAISMGVETMADFPSYARHLFFE